MQTFKNVVSEDLKPYLKEIKAKTLLIWGNKDSATPLKDGNTMNKLISNSEILLSTFIINSSFIRRVA